MLGYRGINSLLLGSAPYESPYWVSFKQALDLGGNVRKGEKSSPVIYYKFLEKRDASGNLVVRADGTQARVPFIRWSNVFNLDQTEGITPPVQTVSQTDQRPCEKAAEMVAAAKLCPIRHGGYAASYAPALDMIQMGSWLRAAGASSPRPAPLRPRPKSAQGTRRARSCPPIRSVLAPSFGRARNGSNRRS